LIGLGDPGRKRGPDRCHIGHHLTNNGESPGGLLMVVNAGGTPLKAQTTASPAATNGASGATTGMSGMSGHGSHHGSSTGGMSGMNMSTTDMDMSGSGMSP